MAGVEETPAGPAATRSARGPATGSGRETGVNGVVSPNLRQFASSLTLAHLAELAKTKCVQASGQAMDPAACLEKVGPNLPELMKADLVNGANIPLRKALDCVEETLMQCRDEQCDVQITACAVTEGVDRTMFPTDFLYLNILAVHLRKQQQPLNLDQFVKVTLSEPFSYAKTAGDPKTETTIFVFYEKTTWGQLFGIPAADTKVPPPIAGLICEIFNTQGKSDRFGDASTTYLGKMSMSVLADPAFASLREYMMRRPVDVAAFSLNSLDSLFQLRAFFKFGNPLLKAKLMAKPWPELLTLIGGGYSEEVDGWREAQSLALEGFYVYTERREFAMCRFFAYLFVRLTDETSKSFWVEDLQKLSLYLTFTTAAQAFNSGNGDLRYLKLFWGLGIPGWTTWEECFKSALVTPYVLPNLVRISRSYTLKSPLQFQFVEPTDGDKKYADQKEHPPLKKYLEQVQKEHLYPENPLSRPAEAAAAET